MTKSFVLKLLLLIAVATVAVTAFAQPTAAGAHSARAGKNDFITATFDFGAGVLTGNSFWLDIRISPAGSNALTDLSVPPAAKLPTPYAMTAYMASNLLGRLPGSRLPGPDNVSNRPLLS
ncbi:MAG TPA: hypothetical protein VNV43_07220 [Candidatus Acidoferrales bacterium]|jgi:hypothetical protein|nr:hypothetical protein [Candidatus Acidoferrales bacterium]